MRQVWIAIVLLVLSLRAFAQGEAPNPTVSDDPLTTEQIAVYRAVLSDFLKGSDGALNLANVTEPLDQSDKECFRLMGSGIIPESTSVIHRLEPSLMTGTKVVLVDPDRQRKAVEENDPQKLIEKAVEGHEEPTNKQMDESLKRAFNTALFTLSEIVFDQQHHRAVVAYSFACRMLCSEGKTLLLKKVGHDWKVAKRCGGYVSFSRDSRR